MKVLVIPEDFRKDKDILKPIMTKMFIGAGKANSNIQICIDPLLGGVSEALKWERISDILV